MNIYNPDINGAVPWNGLLCVDCKELYMKPMGRKYYKDKTGGKHHVRFKGKFMAWWVDVCQPNKKADRQKAKKEILQDN